MSTRYPLHEARRKERRGGKRGGETNLLDLETGDELGTAREVDRHEKEGDGPVDGVDDAERDKRPLERGRWRKRGEEWR